jgi:hypothetical protein
MKFILIVQHAKKKPHILMKEALKDKMFVSVEKIAVYK